MSRYRRNLGGAVRRVRQDTNEIVYRVVVSGWTLNGVSLVEHYGPFRSEAAAKQVVNSVRKWRGTPRCPEGTRAHVWIEYSGYRWEEMDDAEQGQV